MEKKAEAFATAAHYGQSRDDGEPYISHPARVVNTLKEMGVEDADLLCAAWLHDVIEDTEWSYDDIREIFNRTIADIVRELTLKLPDKYPDDWTTEDRRELKTLVLMGKASSMSIKACIIKLADRIDNLQGAKETWKPARTNAYGEQALRMMSAMKKNMNSGYNLESEDWPAYCRIFDYAAATCSNTYKDLSK